MKRYMYMVLWVHTHTDTHKIKTFHVLCAFEKQIESGSRFNINRAETRNIVNRNALILVTTSTQLFRTFWIIILFARATVMWIGCASWMLPLLSLEKLFCRCVSYRHVNVCAITAVVGVVCHFRFYIIFIIIINNNRRMADMWGYQGGEIMQIYTWYMTIRLLFIEEKKRNNERFVCMCSV